MRSWLGLGDLKTVTILTMVERVFILFLTCSHIIARPFSTEQEFFLDCHVVLASLFLFLSTTLPLWQLVSFTLEPCNLQHAIPPLLAMLPYPTLTTTSAVCSPRHRCLLLILALPSFPSFPTHATS
ncbi:hypothetical protein B0T13DRAFT_92472 [Neurospora crassa]|nr:hypothetical protein B0T13DRAFT_92472 [Neurospora crassa]